MTEQGRASKHAAGADSGRGAGASSPISGRSNPGAGAGPPRGPGGLAGRTGRGRVYAAGDVATYAGKVKLIATGFGEAATAVNNIAVDLDPAAHLFPGHSSNAG